MAVTHKSQIETAISRLPQTAYRTPRAAGDDYRRILSDDQSVADLDTAFRDDANYDAGSDLANDVWAITNDSGLSLTPDFCFQDAPFLIHDILGGYSVSGPDGGLYTHVQTPQSMNVSRQLPSRTILKKYGGIGLYMFPDMVSRSLVISGGKTDRIKMAARYQGSGAYEIDPASYAVPAIVNDREWGYSGQATVRLNETAEGTAQVETATAAGTITGTGNASVQITAAGMAGSPIVVSVPVTSGDTAAVWAGKVRTALRANSVINSFFIVSGSGTSIVLTARVKAANDATMNIWLDNGTSTGITPAATSANTTAGVAGDYQTYSCDLESWSLSLENPAADEGYRTCSEYLVAGDPKSGSIRSESLVGARNYMFEWTARMQPTDKTRGWMKAGAELTLDIPIIGIEANDFSTRINHNKLRVVEAKEITGAGGDFIGISGKARLMAVSGAIGLTITTVNNVASYTS
jgi:hypothetical protein